MSLPEGRVFILLLIFLDLSNKALQYCPKFPTLELNARNNSESVHSPVLSAGFVVLSFVA